jgi:hypothetical protein
MQDQLRRLMCLLEICYLFHGGLEGWECGKAHCGGFDLSFENSFVISRVQRPRLKPETESGLRDDAPSSPWNVLMML